MAIVERPSDTLALPSGAPASLLRQSERAGGRADRQQPVMGQPAAVDSLHQHKRHLAGPVASGA